MTSTPAHRAPRAASPAPRPAGATATGEARSPRVEALRGLPLADQLDALAPGEQPREEPAFHGVGGGSAPVQLEAAPDAGTTPADGAGGGSLAEREATLARATELTAEMAARSEQVRASVAATVAGMGSPPSLADVELLEALVADYEAQLMTWRPMLMALDQPETRWALEEAAAATGQDFGALAAGFQAAFEHANAVLFEATDVYNATEIGRERDLASAPRAQRLRASPGGGGARGDRDWAPIHVPGLVIAADPLTGPAPSAGRARGADAIDAVVVHTGSSDAEGTVDTLEGRGLAGHYAVGVGGDARQMYPASQSGAHAAVANAPSVAIDLAYGGGSSRDSQVAFLDSGVQLVAAAKIITTHARLSPALAGGGVHARGELLGEHLADVDTLGGAYGGVATYGGAGARAVAGDLDGVVAHESLPDSDHSDPGQVYMLRLAAMIPLLEAYERRYGPLRLDDPAEVERVVAVIERYEAATGRAAGGVSQTELWRRVRERFGETPLPDVEAGELDRALDDTLEAMQEELALARHGEGYDAARDAVRAELDREIPDRDIVFEGSVPERSYLRDALGLARGDDPYDAAHAADVATARGTSAYRAEETRFRRRVRASVTERIVRESAYVDAMDENLAAFRAYLEEHLPELLR